MPNYRELIDCFTRAREFVSLPTNDFAWTSWEDVDAALWEIDVIIEGLRYEKVIEAAWIVFLPTGPIQELAISSGWGEEDLALAGWFNDALESVDCVCYDEPLKEQGEFMGTDSRYGDTFIGQCTACGRFWLRYHYELEAITGSGRGFLAPLPRDRVQECTPENAIALLESVPWYFAGGSFFGGNVSKQSGPLPL